jgi:hypothetical protein
VARVTLQWGAGVEADGTDTRQSGCPAQAGAHIG